MRSGPAFQDPGHAAPPVRTRSPGPRRARCPLCGAPRQPFDVSLSAALDALLLAKEALEDAQALLEEAVLP